MATPSIPGTERAALRARLGAVSRWGSAEDTQRARTALGVLGAAEAIGRVHGPITRGQRDRLRAALAAIPVERGGRA